MPEVMMPRLSDTMEEGELSKWLKNVGDTVHKGDVLAEIETDKATMDLECFEDGVLEQQLVTAGTVVPIGQPVAIIGTGKGDTAKPAAPGTQAAAMAAPETDAAAAAAPETHAAAEEAGPAEPEAEHLAEPDVAAEAQPKAEAAPAAAQATTQESRSAAEPASARLRTSPLARKIAKEHDINLAAIQGSGPDGRIVRADVEAAIEHPPTQRRPTNAEQAVVAGAEDQEIPLNNVRKVTAKRLTESQAVPHFFLTNVVNVERMIAFRTEINESLAASGAKVSINDLIVRAAAVALRAHPDANSSWGGDKLIRHGRVNVGIAVATGNGLLVPVIADADRKTLSAIAGETVALAERARAGKLGLKDMTGGTFSISNLGMFGVDQFTAVINPPEAAILAVGAASPVPVLRDGALVDVPKMKITLTVDHRVMDGATAAAFLRELTDILEHPIRIVV
jgi:pyruvate dehydrogenase E2 component (dihydrolipoamide acetyltransferase)